MTNYGTIPSSESPEGSSRLKFITTAKERLKSGLATRRSWRQMAPDFHHFILPTSGGFRDALFRVKSNLGYFRVNYAIIVLIIVFLSLLWHPVSMIVFFVMMAVWVFLYFLRDEPLVILHRTINDKVVLSVLSVLTVVALLLTHATGNILISLLVGLVVVLIHASVRKTDDLCVDEEALGKRPLNEPLSP